MSVNLIHAAGVGIVAHFTGYGLQKAVNKCAPHLGERLRFMGADIVASNLGIASFATAYFLRFNVYRMHESFLSIHRVLDTAVLLLSVCSVSAVARSTLYRIMPQYLPKWVALPSQRGER